MCKGKVIECSLTQGHHEPEIKKLAGKNVEIITKSMRKIKGFGRLFSVKPEGADNCQPVEICDRFLTVVFHGSPFPLSQLPDRFVLNKL